MEPRFGFFPGGERGSCVLWRGLRAGVRVLAQPWAQPVWAGALPLTHFLPVNRVYRCRRAVLLMMWSEKNKK